MPRRAIALRLELLDIVVIDRNEGADHLDVALCLELRLEADTLLVTPAAQLVHLGAQSLGTPGSPVCLLDLAFKLRERIPRSSRIPA